MTTPDRTRCPRCEAARIANGVGALSRATRDDGPGITVCPRCGEREAHRQHATGEVIPFTEWPVSVDDLLDEERAVIEFGRSARWALAWITPDDARRLLDPDDDARDLLDDLLDDDS